jgi:hypothetical protein
MVVGRLGTLRYLVSDNAHNRKIIRHVLRETLARILRMKVQRVISYAQRVEQDIESVIYRGGIYAGWHISQMGAFTGCIKHIVVWKRDRKTLDLTRCKFVIALPSTVTDRLVAPSMKSEDALRSLLTGMLLESCPHTLGVLMFTLFMTGR